MKKSILALIPTAALVAALALTGCSTTGTATGSKAPVASTTTSAPAAAPATPSTAAFGTTWKYKDGVTVSVAAPVAYTPSETAAGATQAQQVALTFTITNGSAKNLNPLVSPKVSSSGTEAAAIIDVENAQLASFAPTTVILPGGTSTWTQAFSVADASKLIVQLSPAVITYDDAIFTNAQ